MPNVPREYLDARRRQILNAAHRCFARRGLYGTTMQEIAAEAGLSTGALYRYFDGKEALIESLAEWVREIKREALAGLEPGGGAEALVRVVRALLEPLASDSPDTRDALRLDIRLWGEALDQAGLRGLFRKQMAALKEPIARFLEAEREAGRIRSDVDPGGTAIAVVALLAGAGLQKALDPRLDLEPYTEAIGTLLGSLGQRRPRRTRPPRDAGSSG